MTPSAAIDLQSQCDLLRSLHRPGAPLLLPNAWDVAAALGYEDQERAPAASWSPRSASPGSPAATSRTPTTRPAPSELDPIR
jgi:hypothetical protein